VNDKGRMTQDEVGHYLGLTKMRISQIEKQAIAKIKKRIHHFVNKEDLQR
jgi:DNA-directed RNA polymerase specialized sigma subunit